MDIAVIDIVFTGIILLFALHCAVKGFVSEVMSLAAVVLGLLAAIFFFRATAAFIRESYMQDTKIIHEIFSFTAIFFIVFALTKLIGKMLKTIIEGIHLGVINKILGFVFGVAEGLIIVCLLLFLISVQPLVDSDSILKGSLFAEWLMPFIIEMKEFPGGKLNIVFTGKIIGFNRDFAHV